MKSVWVVSSGDYDGGGVVAIFSTEAKAWEFVGEPNPARTDIYVVAKFPYVVAEFPIDLLPPLVWSDRWEVDMLPDGSATVQHSQRTDRGTQDNGEAWSYHDGCIHAYSWISADHAMKLAAECREGKGGHTHEQSHA